MLTLIQDTFRRFRQTNRAMTLLFLSSFVFLGIGAAGMLIDPRQVLNAPGWVKLTKFSISLLLYSATMLWMFSYIRINGRLKSFVLTASAVLLFIEMVVILVQSMRAVPSHFNISTPFDATLWSIMGVSITLVYVVNIVGFILFLRQPIADRTLAWSMKLGLFIMLVGFGVAFLMTGPSAGQLVGLEKGLAPTLIGAHTVGAPDGGAGLPLVGWSTTYGDLRVAHFVGLHGPQVLALFGVALILLSRRQGNRLTEKHRVLMVVGAFFAYLGVVGLVTWQALRMQPLIAPDALTLAAFAALGLLFVTYNALVIWSAHRTTAATVRQRPTSLQQV